MRLGLKSVAAVTLLVVGGVGMSVVAARTQVLSGFRRLEQEEAEGTSRRVAGLLGSLNRDYRVKSQDWGEWNDMTDFLATGNEEFKPENLGFDSFVVKGWAQMAIVRADRTRVFEGRLVGEALLPPTPSFEALIDGPTLIRESGPQQAIEGFVALDGALWTLAAQPILNADRTPGPITGQLVFATPVDAGWIARAEELTSLDLEVLPLGDAAAKAGSWAAASALRGDAVLLEEIDTASLASYTTLVDVVGAPVAVLRIVEPRPASAAGAAVLGTITRGLFVGGILVAVSVLVLVRRGLLAPLERVVDAVRRLEAGERVELTGLPADEIGTLGAAFNTMSATIRDREAALGRSVAQVTRVLDNTGDALVSCDLDGNLVGAASAPALAWFGPAQGEAAEWLYGDLVDQAAMFELGLSELRDGLMPDEVILGQMPTDFTRGGQVFSLDLRRITLDDGRPGLLLIVRDATAEVARKRAESEARELQTVIGRLLRDRSDFQRFVVESEALFAGMRAAGSRGELQRALHTLKGNMAVFGFQSVAVAAHRAEDRLRDEPLSDPYDVVQPVAEIWWAAVLRIANDVPIEHEAAVEVEPDEVRVVVAALRRVAGAGGIGDRIGAWLTSPVRRLLRRSADTATRVAKQLDREITVHVDAGDIRIDADATWAVWSALGHVVRNAVDHGMEPAAERIACGKPAVGRITLRAEVCDDHLRLVIEDDGRGVDWEAVRRRAIALSLPHDTHAELVDALFHDGVSTREVVTEISGRGFGMSAIRTAVASVEGFIDLTSTPGVGTRIEVLLPLEINGRPIAVAFEPLAEAA